MKYVVRVEIVESKSFTKDFNKVVGKSDRGRLHIFLSENPCFGKVIRASGGLRKLRWRRPGSGKRGGVRIIYYYLMKDNRLVMLSVFAKNEKADLTMNEIKSLSKMVSLLV